MSVLDVDDTIVAIASAPAASLRGIVRISGPNTANCLSRFFQSACGRRLVDFRNASRLEGAIELDGATTLPASLLWWPTQRSYTRQPAAEIHMIGCLPLLDMVLETCCSNGARLAQPGEFTLRAFLSGRIDLTQAEAVLAIIDSRGRQQFDAALQQLAGGLRGAIADVRNSLLELLAELEAGLDFVEEDIEFISQAEIARRLEQARQQIESTIASISDRAVRDELIRVVLIGQPNAGKSSLFNELAQGTAIVSDIEGTTRDYLTATISIDGTRIQLIDTAGLHRDDGGARQPIDEIAAQQARSQLDTADIRLLCLDPAQPIADWQKQLLQERPKNMLVLQTKSDLHAASCDFANHVIRTSIVDNTGLAELHSAIGNLAAMVQNTDSACISPAIARASESLADARDSIALAAKAASCNLGDEVLAAEARAALDHLGRVVGTIYTDDILDVVFGRFCIGK